MRCSFSFFLRSRAVVLLLLCGLCGLLVPACGDAADSAHTPRVLWRADHEKGDLSQWESGGHNGIWISSTAHARITNSLSHSGRYSVALSITNADGTKNPEPGVRMARVSTATTPTTLPDAAYYSVWFYFPQVVRPVIYWNLFQWKRAFIRQDGVPWSDPLYSVNVGNRADGTMYFYLYSYVGSDGGYMTKGNGVAAQALTNIPLKRWIHLECYYGWSRQKTGRVACWQDGHRILNVADVVTEYGYPNVEYPRQWTVNNYSGHTDPPTHTIYIDDAIVSDSRIGID
ncbi:MAG: hypothetical protein FJ147_05630 [Deltaproteobacteria bacterium]|nr:hypothetical protein [Deltaproteobacteria bacterium]